MRELQGPYRRPSEARQAGRELECHVLSPCSDGQWSRPAVPPPQQHCCGLLRNGQGRGGGGERRCSPESSWHSQRPRGSLGSRCAKGKERNPPALRPVSCLSCLFSPALPRRTDANERIGAADTLRAWRSPSGLKGALPMQRLESGPDWRFLGGL